MALRQTLVGVVGRVQALHTFSHVLHVAAAGPSFGADHAMLRHFYEQVASVEVIDALLERVANIWPPQPVTAAELLATACEGAPRFDASMASMPDQLDNALELLRQTALALIEWIKTATDQIDPADPEANGLENLLQGLADSIQTMTYQLGRRLLSTQRDPRISAVRLRAAAGRRR